MSVFLSMLKRSNVKSLFIGMWKWLVIDRTLFLPNRTIFLPNYSSVDRTMFGQNPKRPNVFGKCAQFLPKVRFGSAFAERVRGSVDHYCVLCTTVTVCCVLVCFVLCLFWCCIYYTCVVWFFFLLCFCFCCGFCG